MSGFGEGEAKGVIFLLPMFEHLLCTGGEGVFCGASNRTLYKRIHLGRRRGERRHGQFCSEANGIYRGLVLTSGRCILDRYFLST